MICIRCGIVAELDVRPFHLAATFDIDVLGTVDQDVADVAVLQQQLQGAQAKRLVQDLVDQPLAFVAIEQRVFGVAEMLDDAANFAPQDFALEFADSVQVELVDEFAVDSSLQILELFSL